MGRKESKVVTIEFVCDKMDPKCDESVRISEGEAAPYGSVLVTVSSDADGSGEMQGKKSKLYFCPACMVVFDKKFGKTFSAGEVTSVSASAASGSATGRTRITVQKKAGYAKGFEFDMHGKTPQNVIDWYNSLSGAEQTSWVAKYDAMAIKPTSGGPVPGQTSIDEPDDSE